MKRTDIEWTDLSANPLKYRHRETGRVVWACVKHSSGCAHCYAEAIAHHYDRGKPFTRANMADLEPFLDEKDLRHILTAKTIGGRPVAGSKCFAGDMTDWFGEWVADELLDRLFATIALRPDVTFQVLTKRADRMAAYFSAAGLGSRLYAVVSKWIDEGDSGFLGRDWLRVHTLAGWAATFDAGGWHLPLPNLWLGCSVEHQGAADARIPHLLETPAAVRFLSCEPLLGPVSLTHLPWWDHRSEHAFFKAAFPDARPPIDWIIVGGESGHHSRPFGLDWARSLVRQCKAAGVACFVKQVGSVPALDYYTDDDALREEAMEGACRVLAPEPHGRGGYHEHADRDGQPPPGTLLQLKLKDKAGGDPLEWPSDLRVREFPAVPA